MNIKVRVIVFFYSWELFIKETLLFIRELENNRRVLLISRYFLSTVTGNTKRILFNQ